MAIDRLYLLSPTSSWILLVKILPTLRISDFKVEILAESTEHQYSSAGLDHLGWRWRLRVFFALVLSCPHVAFLVGN